MAPEKDVVAVSSGREATDRAMHRPPVSRSKSGAVFASDEVVRGISARIMANRIDAYRELAKYDSN